MDVIATTSSQDQVSDGRLEGTTTKGGKRSTTFFFPAFCFHMLTLDRLTLFYHSLSESYRNTDDDDQMDGDIDHWRKLVSSVKPPKETKTKDDRHSVSTPSLAGQSQRTKTSTQSAQS